MRSRAHYDSKAGAICFHLFSFLPVLSPFVRFSQKCLERFEKLQSKLKALAQKQKTLLKQVIYPANNKLNKNCI